MLDLGCGAGLDTLVAARRVGPSGEVIGADFSDAMLDRARQAAKESNTENARFEKTDAERLPLAAASVDVALVNGIFNLNPSRASIFTELGRVLRGKRMLNRRSICRRGISVPDFVSDL